MTGETILTAKPRDEEAAEINLKQRQAEGDPVASKRIKQNLGIQGDRANPSRQQNQVN